MKQVTRYDPGCDYAGQRGREQAVAVGFSSQLTDSVIGKVSVADD